MVGGADFALAAMERRLAGQQVTLVAKLQTVEQVVQPDDVEVLDSRLVARIRELGRTASLDARNRDALPESPDVLQDRQEILIAGDYDRDVVGVRQSRVVEERAGERNVDAFLFRLKGVGVV